MYGGGGKTESICERQFLFFSLLHDVVRPNFHYDFNNVGMLKTVL